MPVLTVAEGAIASLANCSLKEESKQGGDDMEKEDLMSEAPQHAANPAGGAASLISKKDDAILDRANTVTTPSRATSDMAKLSIDSPQNLDEDEPQPEVSQ